MKKFIFFPLWKIEKIEKYLKDMELHGYRLDCIKYSYIFYFKESTPKEMCYFLSYKSFIGTSMGSWDYAMVTNHRANQIRSKMCFFKMYRTKKKSEKILLLYETRLDYIKAILLEKALMELSLFIIFSILFTISTITQPENSDSWIIGIFVMICLCFTAYHFLGFFKQKNKCKVYEKSKGKE